MKNIAILIEYDGLNYSGWQIQPNGISIQETLENALTKLYKRKISIIGAGRTDAQVHAYGQVANFKVPENNIPFEKIPVAINSLLNPDIRVLKAKEVPLEFNSRFDAIAREYVYKIALKYSVFKRNFYTYIPYQLNIEKLFAIADLFLGEHNFTAFSKHNPDTNSYICNVEFSRWEKIDKFHYLYRIKANRFVYGMVRSIVGTMIDYARGYKSKDEIEAAFAKQTRDKISALAQPFGLYLNKIFYIDNIFD